MGRIGWDEYFLGIAQAVSARGDCIRRKVGAVLVDADMQIIATGYNGSDPGGPSCLAGECPRCLDNSIPSGERYENCIETHAEDNALRQFSERYARTAVPAQSTMYITTTPCENCAGLMDDYEVSFVVWPWGFY